MSRVRLFSIIFVILIIFSGINIVFNFNEVSGATLYVGSTSTYKTIQSAIDGAGPGDTVIVDNGTYYESVTVDKANIILIGNSTSDCKIIHNHVGSSDSDYAAAINVTAGGVRITGFNISVSGSYTHGIRLNKTASSNSNILGNNITTTGGNGHGIFIYISNNSIIKDNNIITEGRSAYGIYVYSSLNNKILNNTISNSGLLGYGIFLFSSSKNNNLSNNRIFITGWVSRAIYLFQESNNTKIIDNYIETTNTNNYGIVVLSSSRINIIKNRFKLVGTSSYAISLSRAPNNNITRNSINVTNRFSHGIQITQVSNKNNITDNKILVYGQSGSGIIVQSSNANEIENNKILVYGQSGSGIIVQSSNANEIENNKIMNYGDSGMGLYLLYGMYNNITKNNITTYTRNGFGIQLFRTSNNNLTNNIINTTDNYGYGIYLNQNCDKNNLTFNSIDTYGQRAYGIFLNFSSTHNKLMNNQINTTQTYSFGIYLLDSSNYNELISNIIITDEDYGFGINISQSSFNNLTWNIISTSRWMAYGIYLTKFSNNNSIESNYIMTSFTSGYGIFLLNSSWNNTIINNTVNTFSFNGYGIVLQFACNNNEIVDNKLNSFGMYGVGVYLTDKSNYNNVTSNIIKTNGQNAVGIETTESSFNNYINNIINTTGAFSIGIKMSATSKCSDHVLKYNTVNTTNDGALGIWLWKTTKSKFIDNQVLTSGNSASGLRLETASTDNYFELLKIKTTGSSSHGIEINDSRAARLINCDITTTGSSARGFYLIKQSSRIIDSTISTNDDDIYIVDNGNLNAINCNFKTVEVTRSSGGVLRVKNYLTIQVYDEDGSTPLPNTDVEVRDNDNRVEYSTQDYGGSDPRTNANGRIEKIIVTDRWYNHQNTATENITDIKVKKMPGLYWEELRDDVDMSTSHIETFTAVPVEPPAIPSGLTVERIPSTNSLNISWNQNLDTINYEIYTNRTGAWEVLDNISHPQTWIWDLDLPDETWYYYKIRAWSSIGLSSGLSPPVSYYLTDITPPATPTGLKCNSVPKKDVINISWNLNTDDTVKYDIYWLDPESDEWTQLGNISHPTRWTLWSHDELVNGTTYKFKIKAWDNVALFSPFSSPVSVVHYDLKAPSVPKNLKAVTISKNQINLSWTASLDSDVVGYDIYMNKTGFGSGGPFVPMYEVTNSSYEVTGLVENTTYYFMVIAYDEANNTSPFSNEAWNTTFATTGNGGGEEPSKIRPKIVNTNPVKNSTNVPIDVTVVITFSIPMNTTDVLKVLSMSPAVKYNLTWNTNRTIMHIDFKNNLNYDTEYTITIGNAKSKTGLTLQNAPFQLTFRTRTEEIPEPPIPSEFSINITSPAADTVFKPDEEINVTGTSTNLLEWTIITVTLNNQSIKGRIDSDGNWSVVIITPLEEGNYIINVSVGNKSILLPIIISSEDKPEDTDKEGDGDEKTMSGFFIGLIITIILIVLIIIIFFIIRKRTSMERLESEKWREEEYYDYEDEDYRDEHYDEYADEEPYEEEEYEKGRYEEESHEEEEWDEEEWDEEELTDEEEEWDEEECDEEELTDEEEEWDEKEWDEEEIADEEEEWDEEEWDEEELTDEEEEWDEEE